MPAVSVTKVVAGILHELALQGHARSQRREHCVETRCQVLFGERTLVEADAKLAEVFVAEAVSRCAYGVSICIAADPSRVRFGNSNPTSGKSVLSRYLTCAVTTLFMVVRSTRNGRSATHSLPATSASR